MKLSDLKKSGYRLNVPDIQFKGSVKSFPPKEKIFMSKEEMEELKNIVIPEYEKEWVLKKEEIRGLYSEVEISWMLFIKTKKRDRLDKAIESVYQHYLETAKKSKKYEVNLGFGKVSKFIPTEWARERTKKLCSMVMKDDNVFYK